MSSSRRYPMHGTRFGELVARALEVPSIERRPVTPAQLADRLGPQGVRLEGGLLLPFGPKFWPTTASALEISERVFDHHAGGLDHDEVAWVTKRRLVASTAPALELVYLDGDDGPKVLGVRRPDGPPLCSIGQVLEATALGLRAAGVSDPDELEVVELKLDDETLTFGIITDSALEGAPGQVHPGVHVSVPSWHDDKGTIRVSAFARRVICANGVVAHVCDGRKLRVRRSGDAASVAKRISDVVAVAWTQAPKTVAANARGSSALPLTRHEAVAWLTRQRSGWALTADVLRRLIAALDDDELGPTGTVEDLVNALSRVGTHSTDLNTRLAERLRRAAGELPALIAGRGHECPTCGCRLIG